MAEIDLEALLGLRVHAASMVAHYGDAEEKAKQNAALVAAGLKPLWSDHTLAWDLDQGAKYRRYVAALDVVLAQLGAGVETEAAA